MWTSFFLPMEKIITLGRKGSFHDLACAIYFGPNNYDIQFASDFETIGNQLKTDAYIDLAMIAIENNIAGTILDNYRIIKENDLFISGEIYLPIAQNLMALPNQNIEGIAEVHSHPMAIKQCRTFLNTMGEIKIIESPDTAFSAQFIAENNLTGVAAIASTLAAKQYGLEIIAPNIESIKPNRTRFFVISRKKIEIDNFDKASIRIVLTHKMGSLAQALNVIYEHNINISKLQSFPIAESDDRYNFHIDLELKDHEKYYRCIEQLKGVCSELQTLGEYLKHRKTA